MIKTKSVNDGGEKRRSEAAEEANHGEQLEYYGLSSMLLVTNKPPCVFPQTETLRWRTLPRNLPSVCTAACAQKLAASTRTRQRPEQKPAGAGPPGPRLGAAPAPPNPTRAETRSGRSCCLLRLLRRVCCVFGRSDRCMEAEVEVRRWRCGASVLRVPTFFSVSDT